MSATVPEHLARYAEIDVALDPFPYNGTTTTCEALWMGVPVVTLAGDRHAARVGASLLTAACHPEWIAASRPDYVRIAAGLAAAPELRARLRAGLREEMKQSALLDHPGQAARFAAAVRQAWAAWCETQAVCALPA
jgi:predicted O-linked N-acetylglucosamine transferase (SPINDLY family)